MPTTKDGFPITKAQLKIAKQVEKEAKKKEAKPEKPVLASLYMTDTDVFEEIYDSKYKTTQFIKYDSITKQVSKVSHIERNSGKAIFPISNAEVHKGIVKLPSDTEDYISKEQLVNDIQMYIHKYCEVDPRYERLASYYVLLTWIQDKLNTMPYLRLLGNWGTGKTRFSTVVGQLCYKSITMTSVTDAGLFRTAERWKGTMIFEEFVPKDSSDEQAMIQMLNAGFERGKFINRQKKSQGDYEPEFFDPFGAKILDTRKDFKAAALESRCFTYITHEKTRTDIPDVLTRTFYEEALSLRNKLLLWRLHNILQINDDILLTRKLGEKLNGRAKQAVLPLTMVCYDDVAFMQDFEDYIGSSMENVTEMDKESFDGTIVQEYFNLIQDNVPPTANKLANVLQERYEPQGIQTTKKIYTRYVIGRRLRMLGFTYKTDPNDIKVKTWTIPKEFESSIKRRFCNEELTKI